MLQRLRRVLDVRPGEGWPVVVCATYVGLTVAAFLLAKPIRDGLFLKQFGAYKLVYAFIAVPVALSVFIPFYNAFAARVGQRTIITSSLFFLSANVVAFWWAFRFRPAPWQSAAFYVWVSCFGVIAPVQAWTFANVVFDTRQARRLFGLVGAGASFGSIVGGLIAQLLTARVGGAVNLLLVLAGLILAAAVVVNLGWRVRRTDLRPPKQRRARLAESLHTIRGTRYLALIATLVFLVAVVTQWTQYLFKFAADQRFGGDADRLTAFFGAFNFYMGVLAFVLQLVLTGPALRRFGLAVTILLLPLALGLGVSFILLWPVTWAIVLTYAFDQSLRFSVDKASFELLYLPLDPRIKGDVKATIDLVINRLADGVGGILLGLATQGFVFGALHVSGAHLGTRGIAAMSLVGIAAWVIVANALRRGYVDAIRDSVRQHRIATERAVPPAIDRHASDVIARHIQTGDPGEILYALSIFEGQHRGVVHPVVRGLLTHPDASVRRRAVAILDNVGDEGALPEVEALLRDPSLEVRTEALLFLSHREQIDPLQKIQDLPAFEDFSIQASIISFLSRPGASQNLDAARVLLDRMLADRSTNGRRPRLEAARLIGRLPNVFGDALAQLLADDDPEVVGETIRAVGQLRAVALAPRLIDRLADPALAEAAGNALADLGAASVAPLADALSGSAVAIDARREVPPLLARIGTPEAQDALTENLLEPDVALRFRVIQGLNKLRQLHPGLPLDRGAVESVLAAEIMGHYRSYQVLGTVWQIFEPTDPVVSGLHESIQQERERIFRLMGLLWPEFDLYSVWVALQSDNGAIRSNALELLDNELAPNMRELVVPLFDGQVPIAERIVRANRLVGAEVQSREEAVATLIASEDQWLRSCGIYAVGALRLSSLAGEVEKFASDPDPLLRETVRAALARLAAPPPAEPDSHVPLDSFDEHPDMAVVGGAAGLG